MDITRAIAILETSTKVPDIFHTAEEIDQATRLATTALKKHNKMSSDMKRMASLLEQWQDLAIEHAAESMKMMLDRDMWKELYENLIEQITDKSANAETRSYTIEELQEMDSIPTIGVKRIWDAAWDACSKVTRRELREQVNKATVFENAMRRDYTYCDHKACYLPCGCINGNGWMFDVAKYGNEKTAIEDNNIESKSLVEPNAELFITHYISSRGTKITCYREGGCRWHEIGQNINMGSNRSESYCIDIHTCEKCDYRNPQRG